MENIAIPDAGKVESLKSVSSMEEKGVSSASAPVDPIAERRAVRKLDWCLIPIMAVFYLMSFLVRLLSS